MQVVDAGQPYTDDQLQLIQTSVVEMPVNTDLAPRSLQAS
jgi:hypothetical protein